MSEGKTTLDWPEMHVRNSWWKHANRNQKSLRGKKIGPFVRVKEFLVSAGFALGEKNSLGASRSGQSCRGWRRRGGLITEEGVKSLT